MKKKVKMNEKKNASSRNILFSSDSFSTNRNVKKKNKLYPIFTRRIIDALPYICEVYLSNMRL